MGIPSYFSQIIRRYANILKNITQINNSKEERLTHLYMDCNSIIYDSYHHLSSDYDPNNVSEFEKKIIYETAKRIDEYIKYIKPSDIVYVSFDGVAPLAKMEQQRKRRYKTKFIEKVKRMEGENVSISWDTSNITPGTDFMKKLSNYMYYYFGFSEMKYNVKQVIVSCSDKPGEGEHKLFSHVRNNDLSKSNIAVYGLDADLIMLSLLHLKYCRRIYVCREAPEFLKSSIPVDVNIGSNESYFLDINNFGDSIVSEMGFNESEEMKYSRINDYVVLCFFLGNDFLPHFISLNIRRNGMDIILRCYVRLGAKLCGVGVLKRCSVSILMLELSKKEEEMLLCEYIEREECSKKLRLCGVLNVPLVSRGVEKYIDPLSCGWESRYYKMLLGSARVCDICVNYVEGLEWVYKYYTGDCPDWRWKYRYNYAPLLKDCKNWIDLYEKKELCNKKNEPLNEQEALKYVMPPEDVSGPFEWAFCKYFWECHPLYSDNKVL